MAFRERFFLLTPTSTDHPVADGNGPGVYHDASGNPMKWSAPFPLPGVGSRVWVNFNGIGWAVVKGYFDSGDPDTTGVWVGLMVLPTKPPAYYRRQTREAQKDPSRPRWQAEGIGCVFGAEILERRPRP